VDTELHVGPEMELDDMEVDPSGKIDFTELNLQYI